MVKLLILSANRDIFLRDFGLSLGALALGRLADAHVQLSQQVQLSSAETTSRPGAGQRKGRAA